MLFLGCDLNKRVTCHPAAGWSPTLCRPNSSRCSRSPRMASYTLYAAVPITFYVGHVHDFRGLLLIIIYNAEDRRTLCGARKQLMTDIAYHQHFAPATVLAIVCGALPSKREPSTSQELTYEGEIVPPTVPEVMSFRSSSQPPRREKHRYCITAVSDQGCNTVLHTHTRVISGPCQK